MQLRNLTLYFALMSQRRSFYSYTYTINITALKYYLIMKLISIVILSLIMSVTFADRCYKVDTLDLPDNICIDCVYSQDLTDTFMCK